MPHSESSEDEDGGKFSLFFAAEESSTWYALPPLPHNCGVTDTQKRLLELNEAAMLPDIEDLGGERCTHYVAPCAPHHFSVSFCARLENVDRG